MQVTAVAGDFSLTDPTGRFTLGANGALTYAGANVRALMGASSVTEKDTGTAADLTNVTFAIDQNGNVVGQTVFSAAALAAGQTFGTVTGEQDINLVTTQEISLTNGDVLKPTWAASFTTGAQSDFLLEGFTWWLLLLP